tara:strand:+ start:772 stop:8445 length:7674 start_codon:yes stop_codon:yes gene_type:complete
MPESVSLPLRGQLENARQLERQVDQIAKRASKNLKIDFTGSGKNLESLAQPLGRITGKADEFGKSMEAANARVIAFGASVGILSAVTKSFKALVSTTIQVEKSLAQINSILNTNVAGLDKLKGQIFDIARGTEQTFDTVAEAALELSRQGLSATEVTKRLNDSLVLARLSGVSASDAVGSLTAAVNGFSKSGLTTSEILNKVSAAANKFAVSERDLFEGFKRSASVAQQAGVSLDELGGIITAVQQKTARGGAVIGNSLKTIFTRIGKPESVTLLKDLGVEITNVQGNLLPATQVIENLAKGFDRLSESQQRQVAFKIGGGFQIAPLLAALQDYSEENSIAVKATQTFANATDEAYKKNIVLNKTLAAGIQSTSLSVQELANALGELGVTDVFGTLLTSIGGVVEKITGVLKGDDLGSTFARGLVKGVSSLILPALGLVVVIIGKLTKDLLKFGANSLKTFLGLGNAAERLKSVEERTYQILLNNSDVRKQILTIENASISAEQKKVLQSELFTKSLLAQKSVLLELQQISSRVAPGIIAGVAGGRSSKISRSAGGFLPVGAEQKDINSGVGGAPRGSKPVVIPNFAFGGGQKGTMVANSSEYIVPNFAGGGSAIFNQDMVKSMGLPSGAKKINAAGGYVPNFARTPSFPSGGIQGIKDSNRSKFFNADGDYTSATLRDFVKNNPNDPRAKAILAKKNQGSGKGSSNLSIDGRRYGIASIGTELKGGNETPFDIAPKPLSSFASSSSLSSPTAKALIEQGYDSISFKKVQVKSLQENELQNAVEKNRNRLFDYFLQPLASYGKDLLGGSGLFKGNDLNDATKLIDTKNNKKLFSKGAEGGIFESAVDLITKGISGLPSIGASETSPFDFEETGSASSELKKAFGFSDALKKADAKRTASTTTVGSVVGKALRDGEESSYIKSLAKRKLKSVAKKASTGYIPNFAMSPIDDAIQREKDAGVPVNQIRINQSGKLRNSQNPNGIAVTNTRDEPTGAIPKNAARGYTPNFAAGGKNKVGDAADTSSAKLFALSTAAFAVQGALSGMSQEATGFTKNLGQATAGLSGMLTTVLLLQGLNAKPGLSRNMNATAGQGLINSGQARIEAGNRISKRQAFLSRGQIVANKVVGAKGVAGGAVRVGAGKLALGFSRLVPVLGTAVLAFQGLGAILKLSGTSYTQLAQKFGLIDGPAERAADNLGKLSAAALDAALNTGKASTKPFEDFVNRVGTLNDEKLKEGLSKAGKEKVESGQKVGNVAFSEALGKSLAGGIVEKNISDKLGNVSLSKGGSDDFKDVFKKLEIKNALTQGSGISNADFQKGGFSEGKIKAFQDLQFSALQAFATPEEFADVTKLVKSGKGEEAGQKIGSIIEALPPEIAKQYEDLVEKVSDLDLGGKDADQKLKNIFKELLKSEKAAEKIKKTEAARVSINAKIAKIKSDANFQQSLTLAGLKTEKEFILSIESSLESTSQKRKESIKRTLDGIAAEKKGRIELAKTARGTLEGEEGIKRSFVTNDIGEIDPAALDAYKRVVEQTSNQVLKTGKLNEAQLRDAIAANGSILGNQKEIFGVVKATFDIKSRELAIEQAQTNLARERATLSQISVDQDKRRLDILEKSFTKENASILAKRSLAEIEKDIAIEKIKAGGIGGNSRGDLSVQKRTQEVETTFAKRVADEDRKIATNDFRKQIFDTFKGLGFKGITSQSNVESLKGTEKGGFKDLIKDLEDQAVKEEKLRINAAAIEEQKSLAIILQEKLIVNSQQAAADNMLTAADTFFAGVGNFLALNPDAPALSESNKGKTPEQINKESAARTDSRLKNAAGIATEYSAGILSSNTRRDKLLAEANFDAGIDPSVFQANFDAIGKTLQLTTEQYKNALAESGASLTTFANLVRAEFNSIADQKAEIAFTLATSTDPDKIEQDFARKSKISTLETASGTGAEKIDKRDRVALFQQKELDLIEAKDAATRVSLEFEYDKKLEIIALARDFDDLNSKEPGYAEKVFEIRKKIAAIKAKDQSLSEKFASRGVSNEEMAESYENTFVDASERFVDNLSNGMADAIQKGGDLGDVLKNVALEFFSTMAAEGQKLLLNKLFFGGGDSASGGGGGGGGLIGNLVGAFSSNPKASGGMITGGSGSKDDVPALLMGGEYVMKKNAVNKYGSNFMESINNGKAPKGIQKFANGGMVIPKEEKTQSGKGGFFIPGTYGGEIKGKQQLLDFATQAFTSGERDVISSSSDQFGGASQISLEPESVRLTNRGRNMGTPLQKATQEAKQQGFGLYGQQVELEKQVEEQRKARKKQIKQMWVNAAISIAASGVGSLAGAAAKGAGGALAKAAPGIQAGASQIAGTAGKGFFSGGSSVGTALKGGLFGYDQTGLDVKAGGALNFGPGRNIGNDQDLFYALQNDPTGPLSKVSDLSQIYNNAPKMELVPEPQFNNLATGGSIPEAAGVDTVPAMLSGGEFVMNSAATSRIGEGNLKKMNSGVGGSDESGSGSSEALVSKLDELIQATKESTGEINITVNGQSGEEEESSKDADNQSLEMAKQLKEQVLKVIKDEKRLGGSLRDM